VRPHKIWQIGTDVSEELAAFIFRVEDGRVTSLQEVGTGLQNYAFSGNETP